MPTIALEHVSRHWGATRLDPLAPLTLDDFRRAWEAAPFVRCFVNTVLLVTMVLAAEFVLCSLAAYAFARFAFQGRDMAFALVSACPTWPRPSASSSGRS